MTRQEILTQFLDAVQTVWGKMPPELTVTVGEDEPSTVQVYAALVYVGTVMAIDRHLLRYPRRATLLVSDKLLAASPDLVRRTLLHEAVHLGYRGHSREFRAVCREVGGAISGSAADEGANKVRIQKKIGSRYQTVREFDDEREAVAWAKSERAKEPGSRWRALMGMEEDYLEATTLEEARREALTYDEKNAPEFMGDHTPADNFPKKCPLCGTSYDATTWANLRHPPKGKHQVVPGAVLEVRNCSCGSTLAIITEGTL